MAGVFQNIDPPPPSPPGGGRTHSLGGERGGGKGGQYFGRRQAQLCSLYSTYVSTLCIYPTKIYFLLITVRFRIQQSQFSADPDPKHFCSPEECILFLSSLINLHKSCFHDRYIPLFGNKNSYIFVVVQVLLSLVKQILFIKKSACWLH